MQNYTSASSRRSSISSEHSDGSLRSTGSRLREKLENRRSILNQVEDGMIRRTDTSNQQQRDPKVSVERNNANEKQTHTGTPTKCRADLERFKALLANKSTTDSRSTNSTLSSSPSETGQRLKAITSGSVSRSRKRKEIAEERLKHLFSAATLSGSFDGRTGDDSHSLAQTKSSMSTISSDESSAPPLPPKTSRMLFDKPAPVNDENIVLCPSPRRADRQDDTRVFADMANLTVSDKPETPEEKPEEKNDTLFENNNVKHHFSQQMNIHVMDNFFTIRL